MNPARIDIPAAYMAPIQATAGNPRTGLSGAASLQFAPPISLRVGRVLDRSRISASDAAGAARTTANVTFLTRHLDQLTEGGRLEVEGRTYDITGVVPVASERRRSWVHLTAQHVKGINTAHRPRQNFAG
jgi:hypothetical protein